MSNDNNTGRQEGDQLTGTVKRYNPKNGFGFITADDGGSDLFVHQSEIKTDGGFRCLEEGAQVKFTYTMREGKPTATNVEGVSGPLKVFKSRLDAMNPGHVAGTVKWFNTGKGFGFIRRDDGDEADVDIFAHIKDCQNMIPLTEKQKVTFTVETEESGRLRARNITVPGMPANAIPLPPHPQHHQMPPQHIHPQHQHVHPHMPPQHTQPHAHHPSYYAPPPPQQYYMPPPPQQTAPPPNPHPAIPTPGTHTGTIKFWNTAKGFGFIITTAGTEIYVGKAGLSDQNYVPQISDTVSYTEETNHEKIWAMNARKIDVAAPGGAPQAGRKRGMDNGATYPTQKATRTEIYQDAHSAQPAHPHYAPAQPAYAPPQPSYNPVPAAYNPAPGQYHAYSSVGAEAPKSGYGTPAPVAQYSTYETQQFQQPSATNGQYDYSRGY